MKTVSIIVNEQKEKAKILEQRFLDYITREALDIKVEYNFVSSESEIIFTFGGDGTLVRALKQYRNLDTPVIGINAGTLGFLTEITEDNLENSIEKILDKEYTIEEYNTLKCEIVEDNKIIYQKMAINDIVLSRDQVLTMLNFDVLINNKKIRSYHADGLIVSTPIGSSAYALSCGGPLIEPQSNIIELTPIAPHSLINRSIVIDNSKKIELVITKLRESEY